MLDGTVLMVWLALGTRNHLVMSGKMSWLETLICDVTVTWSKPWSLNASLPRHHYPDAHTHETPHFPQNISMLYQPQDGADVSYSLGSLVILSVLRGEALRLLTLLKGSVHTSFPASELQFVPELKIMVLLRNLFCYVKVQRWIV